MYKFIIIFLVLIFLGGCSFKTTIDGGVKKNHKMYNFNIIDDELLTDVTIKKL